MELDHNGWRIENGFLSKAFRFDNFTGALSFVQGLGEIAKRHRHCPEILIHSCSSVEVFLRSHADDDVTEKDYSMARQIDHYLYTEELLSGLQ